MDRVVKQLIKFLQSTERPISEIHDLLMTIPIFTRLLRNFSLQTRFSLISSLTISEHAESAKLFSYGDYFDTIMILIQGSVLVFTSQTEVLLEPIKMLNDPFASRSRIYPNNAVCKEPCVVLKLNLDMYHETTIDELENNIKEKVKYVEGLIPGISICTNAQKEKIALLLDISVCPKGTVLCQQGINTEKLLVVLEGECAVVKGNLGRPRTVSKLCKGSFICEDNIIFGKPSEFTIVVSSDKARIGKFKNADVKNNFPPQVLLNIKNLYEFKEKMHDKILRFPTLQGSISAPAKCFPLASPNTLSKIAAFNFRQTFGHSPTDIKPFFKNELERLRDSSPSRINKFF